MKSVFSLALSAILAVACFAPRFSLAASNEQEPKSLPYKGKGFVACDVKFFHSYYGRNHAGILFSVYYDQDVIPKATTTGPWGAFDPNKSYYVEGRTWEGGTQTPYGMGFRANEFKGKVRIALRDGYPQNFEITTGPKPFNIEFNNYTFGGTVYGTDITKETIGVPSAMSSPTWTPDTRSLRMNFNADKSIGSECHPIQ